MLTGFKNFFLMFLVRLFKSRRQSRWDPQAPRILLVCTTALGDTLWASPLLRAIKKTYPRSFISVLTSKTGLKVLERNPYVDRLFLLKEPCIFHFCSLFKTLKKKRFQAVLYLHASQRLPLALCALLNCAYLIGSSGHGKGLGRLFTHRIKTSSLHEIKRRLKLGSVLGIKEDGFELEFFYRPSKKRFLSKPYIIFHPGAKEPFRRWPAEYYIELGKKLAPQFKIALVGVSREKTLLEQIASRIDNAAIFCHLSLSQLASIFQHAELVVCNDSGLLHIAAALKKPILSFFIPTDPEKSGPLYYERAIVLKEKPPCRPCLKKDCLNPYCFYKIKPEQAYAACQKLLRTKEKTPTAL